jgi:ATP-binding cassette subfamily F protein uup
VNEYDTISVAGRDRHVLGYLQDFLFPPERSRSLVKYLSGGERSRLLLAKLFTRPSNVLVLDEPTNDLDLETLELLESLLVEYQGTMLLVSHDRAFLNDVVTSTLVIDGDGRVKEYEGGYDDYLRQRSSEVSVEAESTTKTPRKKSTDTTRGQNKKLSFKERKEIETLPGRIESLESGIRELHEAMAEPSFYRKDRDEIARLRTKLEDLERDLAVAYARWETLDQLDG